MRSCRWTQVSQSLGRSSSKGSSSKRQLRQPGQHEPPASTSCVTLNTPATGLSRGSIIAAPIGVINSNGQTPLHQHRHLLPMCAARELRPRRAPYKCQESAAEPKQTTLQATQRARRRGETDRCYQPPHRPLLATLSTERELRPRRAPVKYYESDDDERPPPRPVPRARRAAAADRRYQATRRAQRLECQKRYRTKHRERLLEINKRYRERHRERIREKDRCYFKANKERLLARQRRYREAHREEVRERQRRYRERCREELKEKKRRYRESHREEVSEKQQRYRESHREELREQQRQRHARHREAHPELVREQNRIRKARYRAKKRMEKMMTLTIPLTDCRTSMPVTDYVQAFCDSLDSVDTPPPESFLQLLEEECPTRLDSGTMQGSEPSDCNDLSFLQDLLSPDEWEQVMDDVQDFDVEAFVDDWWGDMTSSDEGVDLMYDLVS